MAADFRQVAGSAAAADRQACGRAESRTVIRRAAPADLEALVALVRAFYDVDGHEFDEVVVRRALAPLLETDDLGVVLVADGTDDLAGYAVVTWGYAIESGGRDALLDEIFVRERNRGVGERLLRAVLDDCRARGLARMFLETESPNDAVRRFYARQGFEVDDSIWMSRWL
jgi:ribosomal protein S18 acetylase RimI-like enzyme